MIEQEELHRLDLRLVKGKVKATCKCKIRLGETENFKDGSRSRVYIGEAPDFETAVRLFNNPANHDAPFEEEDKIPWESHRRH